MFTGLIEEVGRVRQVQGGGDGVQRMEIEATTVTQDLTVGDSVNINGACQTATEAGPSSFTVESVAETLRLTTLGRLTAGDPVNLERSLRPQDRMGGHIVLGHVDGVGTVQLFDDQWGQWLLQVEPPETLGRYIAHKGSVTIDGISLTVASVAENSVFTIAIIPHTLVHTNLQQVRAGSLVNLEVDVVARYVERLLTAGTPPQCLTLDHLRDKGY